MLVSPEAQREAAPAPAAQCIACGSGDLLPYVRARAFRLYACARCGTLTAYPRPTRQQLLDLHDSERYYEHPYFENRRADRQRTAERVDDLVRRLTDADPSFDPRGVRHLDVGCDVGSFALAMADRHGTGPSGVDIAGRAVAVARSRGLDAYHCDLNDAPPHLVGFGLVTLIDVIEHVSEPERLLRSVRDRMRPSGLCYVETPNIASTVYQIGRMVTRATDGRPAWLCDRLFLPEHVQYFSAPGLTAVARRAGLEPVAIGRRGLSRADVNANPVARLAVEGLQILDRLFGREILHFAVLRTAN